MLQYVKFERGMKAVDEGRSFINSKCMQEKSKAAIFLNQLNCVEKL